MKRNKSFPLRFNDAEWLMLENLQDSYSASLGVDVPKSFLVRYALKRLLPEPPPFSV